MKFKDYIKEETQRQKLARLAREAGDNEYAKDVLSGKVPSKNLSQRIAYYTTKIK